MNPFQIHIAESGHCVGYLQSLPSAHGMAHTFHRAWPDAGPLVVVDSVDGDTWTVKLADCSPLSCDIALNCAPVSGVGVASGNR
jgi:hypothetical protein